MPPAPKPNLRQAIYDALITARPHGLSMDALQGIVQGPWRNHDVRTELRHLWEFDNVAYRSDGTYVLAEKIAAGMVSETRAQKADRRLTTRVKRYVDEHGRRDGHDTTIRTRFVDPALLKAWCPRCRAEQPTRLDGTGRCQRCGTQTGANTPTRDKPRRRSRRRPLTKDDPGFGPVCPKCGGPKGKQAHQCRTCMTRGGKARRGRARGPRPSMRKPRHMSEELLLECRRLYVAGLSIRQVAERVHPQTTYANVNSCKTGLFSLFKTRGWKLRPQAEVTAARNYRHGRKTRTVAGDSSKEKAYRVWLAEQRGWTRQSRPGNPTCKGVKKIGARKLKAGVVPPACGHAAQDGSEYCWNHDPARAAERAAAAEKRKRTLGPDALAATASHMRAEAARRRAGADG